MPSWFVTLDLLLSNWFRTFDEARGESERELSKRWPLDLTRMLVAQLALVFAYDQKVSFPNRDSDIVPLSHTRIRVRNQGSVRTVFNPVINTLQHVPEKVGVRFVIESFPGNTHLSTENFFNVGFMGCKDLSGDCGKYTDSAAVVINKNSNRVGIVKSVLSQFTVDRSLTNMQDVRMTVVSQKDFDALKSAKRSSDDDGDEDGTTMMDRFTDKKWVEKDTLGFLIDCVNSSVYLFHNDRKLARVFYNLPPVIRPFVLSVRGHGLILEIQDWDVESVSI